MRPVIAYLSSELPKRSETFVYREIRELRRRGWDVVTVSLYEPPDRVAGLADLEADRIVVYRGWGQLLADKTQEEFAHPLRAGGLIGQSWADAINPGEPHGLKARARGLAQAMAGQALAFRLRQRGVRHIHCHFAHAPTTVGMYAAKQLGIPFSFTGHANDLFQRRALLKRKLQRAAFVNCISEWHKAFYEQIDPGCGGRCHVVRCGVDVNGWDISARPPRRPGDGANILTVCRLVEKKGVDMLLRGVAAARQAGLNARLTVAGDGPQRPMLQQLTAELQLVDSVSFLGDVENDRVRELLNRADVFALPCRDDQSGDRDGIPVVLMEAMACGRPVISGDLPAIRELIEHQRSGLLVDGRSTEAIAGAIGWVLADPARAEALSLAGRARVVEEFSLAANVDRIERLLLKQPANVSVPQVQHVQRDNADSPRGAKDVA